MKSISLMRRRTDFTRPGFRRYYEERHAPLACSVWSFAKYVRNHVISVRGNLPPLDVVSEFWFGDAARNAAVRGSRSNQLMGEDAARFMLLRGVGAVVQEELLAGQPREIEHSLARKEILFLAPNAGVAPTVALAAARRFGRELAAQGGPQRVARLTLDAAIADDADNLPAPMILSVWLGPPIRSLPDNLLGLLSRDPCTLRGSVVVRSFETPRADLQAWQSESL